jgi:outer membrane receptor for ferrienterochelin and colicin
MTPFEGGVAMHQRSRWLHWALILAVCVFVPSLARAQSGKLTGVVTDVQSGQPIEGAQIVLQGTGIGVLTDQNGRYFILNVPVSTYTVVARRLGFQPLGRSNVQIVIDVTSTVDFRLVAAAQVIQEITVTAAEVPLVESGLSGSRTVITASEIEALPVVGISGVLQLQQGYFQVPENTDIVSFTESRRNTQTPVRIRGGRGGETLTMIDGVPINNFVFGGPAFDITREAVEQLSFERGGMEPQYGNAMSGIINIATREGGTDLAGAVSYQTSKLGGALGNTPDDLLNFSQFEGFLSGPVPGSSERLRFMLAGRQSSGRDRVLESDRYTNNSTNPDTRAAAPDAQDLFPGQRPFGYDQIRDIFGKLTLHVTPQAKLSATAISYQRQRLPFSFEFLYTGYNFLGTPAVQTLTDSLRVGGGELGGRGPQGAARGETTVQGSLRADRNLYSIRWDHVLGRWLYRAAVSYFEQERNTCNFFSAVCMGDRFADVNFTGTQFATPNSVGSPMGGSDVFFGGERLRTTMFRGDLQAQLTDHHNVQAGVFYQNHDLRYFEVRNQGINDVQAVPQSYSADPWDAAFYFQDKIEYDFLTVKLGFRYDYGRAGGLFFANPRDPLNGTSAREVCNGEAFGSTPWTDPVSGLSGFEACARNRDLLDSAAVIARADDFASSTTRRQFSPRIAVSFPLSATSTVFFNFGRYSQNPLYNNLFQNTSIGVDSGAAAGQCSGASSVKPGTGECLPNLFSDIYTVSFLGNPNLLIEGTTAYEVGYAAEIARNYGLSVVLFSKDQYGLSGVQSGGVDENGNRIFDAGATYGKSLIEYTVITNQDFQTVRGFEIQLRRRISNYWGFNINYSFAQASTNAAPPEREFEAQSEEGNPASRQEIRSEIDQANVFNASLLFRVGPERPNVPVIGGLLRNSDASVTLRAFSGLPYTPTTTFQGLGDDQAERNSGRGPSTMTVDLLVGKQWRIGNLLYGGFVRVSNLFDTKNCVQVFPTTGRCDAGTVDQSTRRQGNTYGGESSSYFDRPWYYASQRSVNAGIRVSF